MGGPGPALRQPQPSPPVDARRVVAIATAAWFVVAAGLAPFWTWLGRHDHRIWFWTCITGGLLGLAGLALIGRHRGEGRL